MISLSKNPSSLILRADTATLSEALNIIQKAIEKIALIVDEQNKLIGTLTDGDVRRALLAGKRLDSSARDSANNNFIFATECHRGHSNQIASIIASKGISQLPIINKLGSLIDLYFIDESSELLPNSVVFMAGGKGTRLRPHTVSCPKPMVTVCNKLFQ